LQFCQTYKIASLFLLLHQKYLHYELFYAQFILNLRRKVKNIVPILEKMNQESSNLETALFWEYPDSNPLNNLDIIFPNAKALFGYCGGNKFLSHNFFRAYQHYNLVFVSMLNRLHHGDRVRVYSDGEKGLVESVK